jgi:hypothetical protein
LHALLGVVGVSDASPRFGPAGEDPHPDPMYYAKVRGLRRALAEARTSKPGDVDCVYPIEHAGAHRPGPVAGRLICFACHPPTLEQQEDHPLPARCSGVVGPCGTGTCEHCATEFPRYWHDDVVCWPCWWSGKRPRAQARPRCPVCGGARLSRRGGTVFVCDRCNPPGTRA